MRNKSKRWYSCSNWLTLWLTLTLFLTNMPFSMIYAETIEGSSTAEEVQESLHSTEKESSTQATTDNEGQQTIESTETVEGTPIAQAITGTIRGMVWLDENEDGAHDRDERQLAAIKLYLVEAENKNQVITETVTDDSGNYSFKDLAAGEYQVVVEEQTLDGKDYLVPIADLQSGTDNKFDSDKETESSRSYSKPIKVTENEAIVGIDAGMRLKRLPNPTGGNYKVYDSTNALIGSYPTLKAAVDASNLAADPSLTILLTGDDTAQGEEATINTGKNILLKSTATNTITQNIEPKSETDPEEQTKRHIKVSSGASLTLENITLAGAGKAYNDGQWGPSNGGVELTGGTLSLGENAEITKTFGNKGGAIEAKENSKVYLKSNSKVYLNQSSDTGGGIYAKDSTVEVSGTSSISENIGQWRTGGIHLDQSSLTVNDQATVTGNIAKHNEAGGIKVENNSSVVMNGGSITANKVEDNGNGGGIYLVSGCTFTQNAGEINQNEATNGAGIYTTGGTVEMTGGTIHHNKASADGGGIYTTEGPIQVSNGEISQNTSEVNGGGIFIRKSTLTITDGKIKNNTANIDGGGIRATGEAILEVTGNASEISENEANYGGGISANENSQITMTDGTISKNTAGQRGGGVNLDGTATTFTMQGGEISENKAKQSGGILADKAIVTITNVKVRSNQSTGNQAGEGYGGGIMIENQSNGTGGWYSAKVTVIDSEFTGNSAYDGGGLYVSEGSQELSITGSTFTGNTARHQGGGIFVNGTQTKISESRFDSNKASRYGGALKLGMATVLEIETSTISGNESRYGGGISANDGSKITMTDTDIIGNSARHIADGESEIVEGTPSVSGTEKENIGGDGGGVNIDLPDTEFKMTKGKIEGNIAESSGGALFATAHAKFTLGGTEAEQVEVIKNTSESQGGALFLKENVEGTISNSLIDANTAGGNGGGARLEANARLIIMNSSLSKNTASYGGGISANSASTVEMNGSASTISDNTTSNFGGGVNIDNAGTVFTMNDGSIASNPARNGGGVFASAGAEFRMNAGLITQNTALNNGAGVYLQATAQLSVTGGTISLNVAERSGGGIFTEDYYYDSPVDADAYYRNITVTGSGEITEDNRSQRKQPIPHIINGPLGFENSYLNDYQVNYFPNSVRIVYDPNGGGGELYEEQYFKQNPPEIATIRSETELKYTPPSDHPEYVFLYWCENADGEGKRYSTEGTDKITMDSDKVLYAIWGPPTTLSGTIFLDKIKNSTYDKGEELENREVTLYKKVENSSEYVAIETTLTNQDGNYYFTATDQNSYKISVKVLDGEYGKFGFVKKGSTKLSSHVNPGGFSDPITIDIEKERKPVLNAGYLESVVVTGVKHNAENGFFYLISLLLAGLVITRIFALRKTE